MIPLSAESKTAVRKNFALLGPRADELVETFYGRLFELEPTFRPMFATDMSEQRKKLIAMLSVVVANLDKPDVLAEAATRLGKTHAGRGIDPKDFEPVGQSLIHAIQTVSGAAFTFEVEQAWLELYSGISSIMIAQLD
nr:globin domain-containing protein [uncultured Rhodoferax sp.]